MYKKAGIILWAGAAALFLAWLYRGNNSIAVTRVEAGGEHVPPLFKGFRIAHISDLHNDEFGAGQKRLLKLIEESAADIIAVTGDLIDSRRTDTAKAMAFIDGATAIAPVYYVPGNHEARLKEEYATLKTNMLGSGVTLLEDTGATITRGGETINILGIKDPTFINKGGAPGKNSEIVDRALKKLTEAAGYKILLTHRPELLEVYAANGVDLTLCGHAHGGQVRIPFVGGVLAPNQGFFPKYSEGIHRKGGTDMVISRGLGNSLCPLRVNNRPEIVIITLNN